MVEQKMLIIGELTQGKELATQLNQLDPLISRETCLDLVEKIVSTYDKALSLLNLRGLKRQSAASASASATDLELVQTFHQSSDVHTKKRKTVERWNEQMRVCSADTDSGGESTKDDGQYRWRKYGQKHILGAKFPRAYYRCTHKTTQGCLATKKVQKTDNDSSSFQICYKGQHTCIPLHSIPSSTNTPRKKISKNDQRSHIQKPADNALFNLQQGLKVETLSINSKEDIFNSISFTPPTTFNQIENVDSHEFFSKLLDDHHHDSDLLDVYSPAFLSPTMTASESDYFPFDMQQLSNFGLNSILQSSESDLTGDMNMILTPTSGSGSGSESSFGGFDFDFCVDQEDFDTSTFLNEALGYFT